MHGVTTSVEWRHIARAAATAARRLGALCVSPPSPRPPSLLARVASLLVCVVLAGLAAQPSHALQIEITGGGPDRLERQRAWANGELPLPGTPDLSTLQDRLKAAGLREGLPIFVRIFKETSELELWMQSGDEFKLFATYPICQWSGVLGPKFYEGDNQSPEGFYTVGRRDLKWQTRHHRSFNIGFPNAFDKLHGRTGSNILVHGGCSTEGCFAMTNPVIDEIFRLANAAFANGQRDIHLHIFPFRMTTENLMQNSGSPWLEFWINLKTGHDLFEESRTPPAVSLCKNRYAFDRVPEFGVVEPERDCELADATTSGHVVTTGSLRATAASPSSGLAPAVPTGEATPAAAAPVSVAPPAAVQKSVKGRSNKTRHGRAAPAGQAETEPQVQLPSGPTGS